MAGFISSQGLASGRGRRGPLGVRLRYHARWCWRRPSVHPPGRSRPGGHRRSRRGARWQRRRWGKAWGLPLRERCFVRHHQVPKWTGMRPLIRIDRTTLYHGGVARPLGVARCLARIVGSRLRLRSRAEFCLSGVLTGGAHRGSAVPVTARTGPVLAASRATLGMGSSSSSAPFRC